MSISVQEYLDKHKLAIKIEEAVNAAVRAQTEDPVAFIVHHLRKHSVSVVNKVQARQVLDARGMPAVEAELHTSMGSFSAIAPFGPSATLYTPDGTGNGDAGSFVEVRGVSSAVNSVTTVLAPLLVGKDPREQADVDKLISAEMDHANDNLKQLGEKAVRAVSLAVCKAGAAEKDMPLYEHIADIGGLPMYTLPAPLISLIRGSGRDATSGLPFRDLLCIPVVSTSFEAALRIGVEVSQSLLEVVKGKFGPEGVRFLKTGHFLPPVKSAQEGFELILAAAEAVGHKGKIRLGLDAGAADFYDQGAGAYDVGGSQASHWPGEAEEASGEAGVSGRQGESRRLLSSEDLTDLYKALATEYKLAFIIDPFEIEDFGSTAVLSRLLEPQHVKVLGGDLLAGSVKRIAQAAGSKTCRGLDLKLSSVSTITDAISTVRAAREADWSTCLSISDGESEEAMLADVAVGAGVHWIRAGPVFGAQHTAKLNRLLRIEEEQQGQAPYLKPEFPDAG